MSNDEFPIKELTDKQHEYWNNANEKWNVKSGATRSGKTFLDYFMIPRRVLETTGKGDILLLGNTRGSLERNVIKPMQEIWGTRMVSNISSRNTVQLFGREAYALGAGKRNSVNIIRGMGVEYCYGDEVVTWDESVFSMLQSRLHLKNSTFDGTCNPEDPDHWFKQWLDKEERLFHQSYTLDDNTKGDPQFHKELKRAYEGTVYYDRYILGKWVKAEGLIYSKFANNPKSHYVELDNIPKLDKIVIGVDFGGSSSKHAFVATGMANNYRDVYILASRRLDPTRMDPNELAVEFVNFLEFVEKQFGHVSATYTDSAEQVLPQGFKTELRRRGKDRVIRGSKKENISDRIQITIKLIGGDRLFYTKYAETAKEALEKALWDDSKVVDLKRLDNGTTDIDTLDAFEYSIERDIWRFNRHV